MKVRPVLSYVCWCQKESDWRQNVSFSMNLGLNGRKWDRQTHRHIHMNELEYKHSKVTISFVCIHMEPWKKSSRVQKWNVRACAKYQSDLTEPNRNVWGEREREREEGDMLVYRAGKDSENQIVGGERWLGEMKIKIPRKRKREREREREERIVGILDRLSHF